MDPGDIEQMWWCRMYAYYSSIVNANAHNKDTQSVTMQKYTDRILLGQLVCRMVKSNDEVDIV